MSIFYSGPYSAELMKRVDIRAISGKPLKDICHSVSRPFPSTILDFRKISLV